MRALWLVAVLAVAASAGAAPPTDAEQRCRAELEAAWRAAADAARVRGTGLASPEEAGRVLQRLRTPFACKEALVELTNLGPWAATNSSGLARSLDAAATNPRATELVERAGLIDKVALALGSTNLVSANETAVTLSLNAAGLLGQNPDGFLARLGGSVTFGAQIPQSEITGFTGLPGLDRLFDAVIWDVKIRLVGDRSPLAQRWGLDRDALAEAGWLDQALLASVPARGEPAAAAAELSNLQAVLLRRGTFRVDQVRQRIATSWLLTLKLAGQHLTEEEGMNKYSGALLLEKGLGASGQFGLTANASYSRTEDVVAGATTPYELRTWKIAAALNGSIMRGVLLEDRCTELALGAEVSIPDDPHDVPFARESLWKVNLSLRFPVTKTAQIPVSITYTNDPNALTKNNYVKGQIGIQYDFGGLKRLAGR